MLPLPDFSLLRPEDVDGVVRAMAYHAGARVNSGGTDLLPSMKYGIFSPATLVSTSRVAGFAEIRDADGGLSIGAGATLRDVKRHPLVRER